MAPLIVAHTLLDITAFVGYALVAPHVDWLCVEYLTSSLNSL